MPQRQPIRVSDTVTVKENLMKMIFKKKKELYIKKINISSSSKNEKTHLNYFFFFFSSVAF